LLAALAAVLVGVASLGNGFVFDDHMLLGGNAPLIEGDAPWISAFTYRYWGAAEEVSPNELYRPVTVISLAANAKVTGPNPAGFHAGNVLLHACNAALVYLLIRLLFERGLLALIASLVFAVHPIATEAVIPISGRADLMATFWLLSASILGLLACRHRKKWFLVGALGVALVTAMGGLSKESAFAAPLVMVAVLGADARRHAGDRRHYREYLMTAVTLAVVQAFTLSMLMILRAGILGYVFRTDPPSVPSAAYLAFVNNPLQFAEPLGRVLTALKVAVMGAGLLLFPHRLSADYSYDQIPVAAGFGPGEAAALAFLLVYLGLVVWSARRFPVTMFALSWGALTYLIVSNLLIPIGTIFGERLLYTPSVGFALLVGAGLARLGRGSGRRRAAAAALAVAVLGLYAGRFIARTRDWRDDATLFEATVRTSPESAKAHSNYGFVLQRTGRLEQAVEEYHAALAIAPGLTGTGISLARTLVALDRPEEAVDRYEKVIEIDDGISVAWSGLGMAQKAAGRLPDAEASFRTALKLSLGRNLEAVQGLAEVLSVSGHEQEAVAMLRRLESLRPGEPGVREALVEAVYGLGLRRLREGRTEEFLEQMRAVVALAPDHGAANYNLALDALERGDRDGARRFAEAGLRSGYEFPAGFLEACGLPAAAPGTSP